MVALFLITIVLGGFISMKEGYHMDELLSFELSNARYNPWIVPTQPEGRLAKFMREEVDAETLKETTTNLLEVLQDTWENRGASRLLSFQADVYEEPVWIGRQQFQDYITVEKKDAFQYVSVYFNVKDDNHPPVHFFLLHTVSSIVQGEVTPWMGCMINLAAIIGICILLMRIGKQLTGNRWYGILAALLYGLSAGAIGTVLLIRMYAILTLFAVWILYLHLQKWETGNWRKKNKPLIAITVLGFLTQYFFLFYMVGLALVTVISLWKNQKKKEVLFYIRSMSIAAIIGVGVFPFCISDVFSSERGVEALGNLAQGLHGYGERLAAFGRILVQRLAGGWFGAAVMLLLIGTILFRLYQNRKKNSGKEMGRDTVPFWMVFAPALIYFLLAAKMSPYLVDRYIMLLFPMVALVFMIVVKTAKIPWQGTLTAVLLLAGISIVSYDGEYLFQGYSEQTALATEYRDLPCVCVYEGYGFYKNLTEFTEYKETLLVTLEEFAERQPDPLLDTADQIVVLVKGEINQEELKTLLAEKYGYRLEEELLVQGVHDDSLWVCVRE